MVTETQFRLGDIVRYGKFGPKMTIGGSRNGEVFSCRYLFHGLTGPKMIFVDFAASELELVA
jgi:uncharacterized protein YodC (DUF2158 family)